MNRSRKTPWCRMRVCAVTSVAASAAISLAVSAICVSTAQASPASPWPIELQQPDGTAITLYLRGDERFHWYEDTAGYTVLHHKGAYVYAELGQDGRLKPTTHLVAVSDPSELGLSPHILPARDVIKTIRANALKDLSEDAPTLVPPSGTVKNLVILCRFNDHPLNTHTRLQSDYDTLFNAVGGHPTIAPTGSVRDLYYEDSYGQMTLTSTVVPWIVLPQDEDYYAAGESGLGDYPQNGQGMVEDALEIVDEFIDFGEFDSDRDGYIDAITIIHSGYGDESWGNGYRIWSHQWSLWPLPGGAWTSSDTNANGENVKVSNYHTEPALWGYTGRSIVRFAVIAHETGHFFGLPDLYDVDLNSEGIGSYCMMSNSWGFDGTQYYPPHFSAWCKVFLGWVEPTTLVLPGTYVAPQVETTPTIYRVDYNYPSGEYLLIENRQPVGHEIDMPQGGLCIWHIDETKYDNTEPGYVGQAGWPENGNHYKVALLQADGEYAMERGWNRGDAGDVYHAGEVDRIDDTTIPNTDAYRDGNIITTYNTIRDIGPAGPNMQFTFDTFVDCNGNNTSDFDDIGTGSSIDCNNNLIPDECEVDCNANGIHDDCDLATGLAEDCQADGVPDDCQIAGTDLPFNAAADNCAYAMSVTTGVEYSGSTAGANSDGSAACGDSESSPDVWYRYRPTLNGEVTISLAGSGYDTVLSVHSGCPGTRDNAITCNDDVGGGNVTSAVTFDARTYADYWIRVSGWSGSMGNFIMRLTGPTGARSATDCNDNGLPDACESLLPQITQQPISQKIAVGRAAQFSVSAEGMDVSYQWMRDGEYIDGATQNVLLIESADYDDAGLYSVKVLSPCGDVQSNAAQLTVDLGLFIEVDGNGWVEMTPPGGVYAENTAVTLTPHAAEGWQFHEWSGAALGNSASMYVLVLQNTNVGARFVPTNNLLTLVKEGEGEVSITPDGGDYGWGESVTLRATPAAGWRFVGWREYTSTSLSILTLAMEGDKTVTAMFEQIPASQLPAGNEQQPSAGMCGNVGPALIPLAGVVLGFSSLLRRRR